MAEISPDLAAKVVAADTRNHVKRVGEGENLSLGERSLFELHACADDAAAMLKARTSKLLQKWLGGGRLSNSELEEIAHILPGTRREESAAPQEGKRTVEQYAEWYGLQRRMYFRWQKAGRELAEGPDIPPVDEPHLLEAWYNRMMKRGLFKHRFPSKLKKAIALLNHDTPSPLPPRPAAPATETRPPAPPAADHYSIMPAGLRGLMHEVDQQEKRVAKLREMRDAAYVANDHVRGDQLADQYNDELGQFSVIKQRAINTLEKERVLVMKSEVEVDLGNRLTELVRGGLRLYERVAAKLEAAPTPTAKRAVWREAWINHCRTLAESGFAPVLELEALL